MQSGSTATFCAGGSTVLTSSASTNNLWSTGATTQSITVSAPGTYTVSIVDGNGCTSATSASATVSEIALPSAPVITPSGPVTFCAGGSVTLTSSYATNNLWSNGATTQSITVSTSGSYSVMHTNGSGCESPSSSPVVVTVNAIPSAPTISAGGPTTFCTGGSVVLTSSQSSGNTWSTGATSSSITATAAGNYTVTYTNGNGCTSLASNGITVVLLANPAAPVITAGGPTMFCQGGSVVLTSSQSTGNTWSTTATTPSITATASGNYTVTYTNGNGCSATSAPTTVTLISTPPTPVITANPSFGICPGDSTILISSGSNNVWSNGATTPTITVNAPGTFTVTSSASGCPSAPSAPANVTLNAVPAAPTITADGPLTICSGDEVVLTSSTGLPNDEWSTSETGASIAVSTAGSYTVTTTNGSGCTATSLPVDVEVSPIPDVTLDPFTPVCDYVPGFELTTGSPAGGTYSGSGVTGSTFDPAAAGVGPAIVTYTYTDANNCTGTAQESLVVNDCAGTEEAEAGSFTIYPNPSQGYFTIASELLFIDAINVYDAAGRLVTALSFEPVQEIGLDLLPFANGVYHAEIVSGLRTQRVQLVINK
jgi:large repetitive protein